jgi:hypothetical protein
MTRTHDAEGVTADAVNARLAELRRVSERLAALTGSAQSPAGTVRAVCRYGRGVSELVIAPHAVQVEGERLPSVVQDTVNAAVHEANSLADRLLDELRAGAQEINEILATARTPADPETSAGLDRLKDLWTAYRDAVETSLTTLRKASPTTFPRRTPTR